MLAYFFGFDLLVFEGRLISLALQHALGDRGVQKARPALRPCVLFNLLTEGHFLFVLRLLFLHDLDQVFTTLLLFCLPEEATRVLKETQVACCNVLRVNGKVAEVKCAFELIWFWIETNVICQAILIQVLH